MFANCPPISNLETKTKDQNNYKDINKKPIFDAEIRQMDFTFRTYEKLLQTLLEQGFSFITFTQYIEAKSSNLKSSNLQILKSSNLIILRHDVEARYGNALRMAQIEHKLNIRGSYYFRIFNKKGNEAVIRQIAALGHELGYHYDDLTASKGDHEKALLRFQKNLNYLRQFAHVTTITMEGAPLSRYDNRDLWSPIINKSTNQQINKSTNMQHQTPKPYNLFGILAEPYFDLDFNQMFYLTDTGRRWDGHLYNVRDKATKENPVTNPYFLQLRYHTTFDLIKAIKSSTPKVFGANPQILKSSIFEFSNFESFPNQAMLNFHPQRWNDSPIPWLKEFIWQNLKNQLKRLLIITRSKN